MWSLLLKCYMVLQPVTSVCYAINSYGLITCAEVTKLQDFYSIYTHVNVLMNFSLPFQFIVFTIVCMLFFFCNFVTLYLNRDIYIIFIGVCGEFESYKIVTKMLQSYSPMSNRQRRGKFSACFCDRIVSARHGIIAVLPTEWFPDF